MMLFTVIDYYNWSNKRLIFITYLNLHFGCQIYEFSVDYLAICAETCHTAVFCKNHLHPLKLEVCINSETFEIWTFKFSAVESDPSFPVISLRHHVCCWHYKWQTRLSLQVALINWRLKSVTASRCHLEVIYSSMKYVCPKASLFALFSVTIYKNCGWYDMLPCWNSLLLWIMWFY